MKPEVVVEHVRDQLPPKSPAARPEQMEIWHQHDSLLVESAPGHQHVASGDNKHTRSAESIIPRTAQSLRLYWASTCAHHATAARGTLTLHSKKKKKNGQLSSTHRITKRLELAAAASERITALPGYERMQRPQHVRHSQPSSAFRCSGQVARRSHILFRLGKQIVRGSHFFFLRHTEQELGDLSLKQCEQPVARIFSFSLSPSLSLRIYPPTGAVEAARPAQPRINKTSGAVGEAKQP